jgi:hypothetical protein
VPDILTGCLSRVGDTDALAGLASDFNARADVLTCDSRTEALAWASVYRVLALSAESALLQRRTGVILLKLTPAGSKPRTWYPAGVSLRPEGGPARSLMRRKQADGLVHRRLLSAGLVARHRGVGAYVGGLALALLTLSTNDKDHVHEVHLPGRNSP